MTIAFEIAVNALLGVLLWALLRQRRADEPRLSGEEEALALFRRRYPVAAGRATLSAEAQGALIELQDGRIGLLQRHGRRWNARMLEARDVSACTLGPDDSLQLQLADFGWPRARLRLAEPATRAAWAARLAAQSRAAQPGPRATRHA